MDTLKWFIICAVMISALLRCQLKTIPDTEQVKMIPIDIKSNQDQPYHIEIGGFTPLETNEGSLIGSVGNLIQIKDRYYVLDYRRSKSVFAFAGDGSFIAKTKIGKGPGELVSPFSMTFDRSDSTVLIHDQALGRIFRYDKDLNFNSSFPTNYTSIIDFQCLEDQFLFVYQCESQSDKNEPIPKGVNYSIYEDNLTLMKQFDILQDRRHGPIPLHKPIYSYNGKVLFVAPLSYNIYELKDLSYNLIYQIDFGNLGFSKNDLRDLSTREIFQYSWDGSRVGFLNGVFHSQKFLTIVFPHDYKLQTYIIDLINQNCYSLGKAIGENKIPYFLPWGMVNDSTFFGTVEPSDFIIFQSKSKHYNHIKIDEFTNPIIIEFTFCKSWVGFSAPSHAKIVE